MEVAPFFVDFHHFLSIFNFFIDFHDLRTFVAIYILSRFTHFFRKFFLAKIASSTTSHVFCMYVKRWGRSWRSWRLLQRKGRQREAVRGCKMLKIETEKMRRSRLPQLKPHRPQTSCPSPRGLIDTVWEVPPPFTSFLPSKISPFIFPGNRSQRSIQSLISQSLDSFETTSS